MSAAEVAAKLVRLEPIADLRYRSVDLEARTVDVRSSCAREQGRLYRFFIVRPTAWSTLPLPAGQAMPAEWKSEVLIVPQQTDSALTQLSTFEAEFSVRTFLQRVECEIDALLGRREGRLRHWIGR